MSETVETLGKYNLVRHIATGGMAEIWLAEQNGPGGFNKELVIKRILPHLARDERFTQMFLDEARLVAQLTHPNIGQIYELGELDGSYFIAMEFIDGLDLAQLLELTGAASGPGGGQGGGVPVDIAVRIICDVLGALDYAHEYADRDGNPMGLVHRDISPQNVLVSNDGIVKLVDFGVAKAAANQTKTEAGAVKGKFAYMAPEQIQSNDTIDRRADLFAVGILLYELLTGIKPFGDDLHAVTQILSTDAQDPRLHRPDIPEPVVRAMSRALAKNRDARYESADAMRHDLEGYLYAANLVTGTREIATLVRTLRGLPAPRTTARAPITPSATPAATPTIATPPPAARITPHEQPPQFVPTPAPTPTALVATPVATPDPTAAAPTAAPASAPRNNGLLVGGFLVMMVAILAAFAAAAYLYFSDDADVQPSPNQVVAGGAATATAQTDPLAATEPTAAPRAHELQHPDGLMVYITTPEPAELFYKGVRVGQTPLQTSLRPGTYQIELQTGADRKNVALTVEPGTLVQRFQFD